MMYLNPTKFIDGSYPPLQSAAASGLLAVPDEFIPIFYPTDKRFAGFVDITDDGKKVLTCVWNEEAYQAYAEANPEPAPVEPEPTAEEILDAMLGVNRYE